MIIIAIIILLIVSVSVGAYVKSVNENNPSVPANNGTVPNDNNTKVTPQPTVTSTPNPTSTPTPKVTANPVLTPAPTSQLPDDCRINYHEDENENPRIYDTATNTTQITLYLQVFPDTSTRRTFILYENQFYLTENGIQVSIINTAETGQTIYLTENYAQTLYITIQVKGNYTNTDYQLAYHNPPLLLDFKKI